MESNILKHANSLTKDNLVTNIQAIENEYQIKKSWTKSILFILSN